MNLFVFGASYCPFTQSLWPQLADLPMIYFGFKDGMDKELYWRELKSKLGRERMTFPTLVIVANNRLAEVKLQGDRLITKDGRSFSTSDLNVPRVDGMAVTRTFDEFSAATRADKTFINMPSQK
jgi:hypothetical protein